jgi:hypothetical protein
MSTNKILTDDAINQLVIAAGGFTVGDARIDVLTVPDGDNTFHFFKVDGHVGSSVREALIKAGKLDRLEKGSNHKTAILSKSKEFAVKVGDGIIQGSAGTLSFLGKTFGNWAEKIAKK